MCCCSYIDGWALLSLFLYLQVSHAPHVCVDFDSSYFLRTDVLLATACARTWSRALRSPLYGNDNSALFFFGQETMARWFRHLKPLWIPCGDNFKEVYEEEWVQEAHTSEYSDQESEYHWRDPSSWYWGTQDPADRLAHNSCDESNSNCGQQWAPRYADPVCLSVPTDDGWGASRELSSRPIFHATVMSAPKRKSTRGRTSASTIDAIRSRVHSPRPVWNHAQTTSFAP